MTLSPTSPTRVTRLVVGLAVSAICLVPLIHFGLGLFFHSLAFRSISREITIILLAEGACVTGGIISRIAFLSMARRHWFRRSVLVIGTGERARFLRDLFSHSDRNLAELHFLGETYLGSVRPRDNSNNPIEALSEVLPVKQLEKELQIDQVVIAVDETSHLYFDHLLPWKANGIPIFDFSSFLERETGRVDLTWTESDWLLYSEGFRFGYLDLAVKRTMDILVSAAFLSAHAAHPDHCCRRHCPGGFRTGFLQPGAHRAERRFVLDSQISHHAGGRREVWRPVGQ